MNAPLSTSEAGRRAVRNARRSLASVTGLAGLASAAVLLLTEPAEVAAPARVMIVVLAGVLGVLLAVSFVRPAAAFRVAAWLFLTGALIDGVGALLALGAVLGEGPWPLARSVVRAMGSLWLWDVMDDAHAASTDPDWTPDDDDDEDDDEGL
ncbi:MAG: hypothetical protein VXZ39_14295 [Planctomycetota bacterium]|nr:hypothetical protein [Planctomycetota bacterium]